MIRPTLALALNSGLPEHIGRCATDRTYVVGEINLAQQRLITDPLAPDEGWWGGWATMFFNLTVTNTLAYVRTPREIARLIVLDICNVPRFIRNGFYEYLQFGTGHRPRGCSSLLCDTTQAFDRADVPLLAPFPTTGPQFIRVYPTDAADVGRRVIVQGLDQNGKVVLGTDATTGGAAKGELLLLQFPFVQSTFSYQEVTGLIKDLTNGPVTIFAVDPTTGDQTQISAMETNETTAGYRQYLFAGLPKQCCQIPGGQVQVYAQAKLDFVAATADTDYLSLPNIPALDEECQSLRYSRMDTANAAQLEAKHHTAAIRLLCGQLDHFEGKTRTAIGVPLFGSNRLMPSFQ